MFLLLRYVFKKLKTNVKDRNILFLGLNSAGKTSLLNHLRFEFGETNFVPPNEMIPTIGLNFSKITYQKFSLTFWDLGGHQKFREVWESYLQDTDILVWLIDSSDHERFEESSNELKKIVTDPKLIYTPIAIIANKQDKEGAIQEEEIIKRFHLHDLPVTNKYQIFLTSFLGDFEQHEGVDKLLVWIVSTLQSDPFSQQRYDWRRTNKLLDSTDAV
eukprot:TRINITY_DN4741_c0_g1_i2.p1 TRINITY_DN4741_c0_g1~~TRINITY_DN4741_c0_g1_i2.p1  ORF type:complete len:216 (-),score=46.26 TRINITY_DN4741_c0_g1_i2:58-705(-)